MTRRVRLIVELDESEQIAGVVHAEDESRRSFSGWLGLMAILDDERDDQRAPDGPGSDVPDAQSRPRGGS